MNSRFSIPWVSLCAMLVCTWAADPAMAGWVAKCGSSKYVCVTIAVSSADGTITLDHEPVNLSVSPPTVVIWKLPEGYVFGYRGAGVAVPHQGEVTEAGGTDDDEEGTGQLTKRYRIKAKQLKQTYKYSITFDEMNAGKPTRRFFCDPTIANSGGLIKGVRQRAAAAVTTSATFTCSVTDEL